VEIKDIKELIDALDKSSVAKLEFVQGDHVITLEKEKKEMVQPVYQNMQPMMMAEPIVPKITPGTITESPVVVVDKEENEKLTTEVKAPLVGVFYVASSPESEPFVKVGQGVEAGETVCILEAMKVLNEIKAPISGTVTAIHVANGDVVEFDQVLLEIGD